MNSKKSTVLLIITISVLVLLVGGATYAFFQAQYGSNANANVDVATKTVDQLSFRMFNAVESETPGISITATQENFNKDNRQNATGTTYGTATFTANNATADKATPDEITAMYNMYVDISANDFEYTTEGENPPAELILTVKVSETGNDADMREITAIEGLNPVTVEGVTGFDVTTVKGLIKIAEDYEIKALSGATTTHKWEVTLTFVNLNSDQNANTNKTFNAELKMQKEKKLIAKYWNDNFSNTKYALVDNKPTTPGAELTYPSFEALKTGSGDPDFDGAYPYYIKTTETENQVCLYWKDTGKEFCMSRNYWVGDVLDELDGSSTTEKLQKAMAKALEVSESSLRCSSTSSDVMCDVSYFYCYADSDGNVSFGSAGGGACEVYGDGTALCH